jgi:hypothetical protein
VPIDQGAHYRRCIGFASDGPVKIAAIPYPHDGYVDELVSDSSRFEILRTLLRKVHSPENPTTKSWHINFRAQSISDAVAISTLANETGLIHLFIAIETLAVELLKEGYLLRGALVRVKLYHDDQLVFGEALIRAYELERAIVRFPRVMIAKEVRGDIDKRTTEDAVAKLQLENVNLPPEKQHPLDEFAKLQATIQKRLNESIDNPRHFEKVQWFARYWGRCVPYGVPMNTEIIGPGMNTIE